MNIVGKETNGLNMYLFLPNVLIVNQDFWLDLNFTLKNISINNLIRKKDDLLFF